VLLLTRNRKRLNDTYPEIDDALRRQKAREFVVDGEVVALQNGVPSFARLQQRMGLSDPRVALGRGVEVLYYLFDVLFLAGQDTRRLTLLRRKELLRRSFTFRDPLRWSAHVEAEGEALFHKMCHSGWEGVIAKRADSTYVHHRSTDWLKFKCLNEQEFVIGGFTEPQGARLAFGALLVGYYEGEALKYAGKVGTGYSSATLRQMGPILAGLERKTSPFAANGLPRGRVHWVEPRLVAQVAFGEWTRDGKLRHPRFLGLRRDKDAAEVVRERPA
jgi:bifunctional non-homologous end joining protein LigD